MERPQDSQQGGYDIPQKELESYPDVFADILNALVYGGEQVVDLRHLSQAGTETRYRDQERRLRNQYEDLGRYETDEEGHARILYLLANQSRTDSRMLLRKCGYVGGCYRGQYEQQMKEICPVMELVLYWGKKRWRTSRSMREFFKRKAIHPTAWRYIDNERLHVFEMRHLSRDIIGRFRSDMRIILEYLADEESVDKLEHEVSHPEALLEVMQALSGDDRYGTVIDNLMREEKTKEGGKWTVCKLMDKYWGGGLQQGRQEGLQQGHQEERQKGIRALISTCRELGATFETTADKVKEKYALDDSRVKESMALYWQ
ncbi:MAG: Rpn family recombination-promoting nuclease/putative transposase [Lachnospiraceae bacterium]|nr:Rpn family recombination-promoting nuclease/putative transposase [Lachnospiraceae bacterium]MCM1238787.1 Rpn family recombination-promoting nuclease/putative transposase [Lachnospiraceae bacterium]